MHPVRQFKLASGEEVICEVLQELGEDDYTEQIIGRRAIEIDIIKSPEDYGQRTYIMKPWFLYGDDGSSIFTLNAMHIVAFRIPADNLLQQYYDTYNAMIETFYQRPSTTEEDIMSSWAKLDVTEAKYANKVDDQVVYVDSDSSNIIRFRPKR
jgi:hypothetical protein